MYKIIGLRRCVNTAADITIFSFNALFLLLELNGTDRHEISFFLIFLVIYLRTHKKVFSSLRNLQCCRVSGAGLIEIV